MAIGDAAFSSGDVMRRMHQLEADLRELRSARRLESSTIGQGGLKVKGEGGIRLQNGGGLIVEDGGKLRVLSLENPDVSILFAGTGDSGRQVVTIRRHGGSELFFTNRHGDTDRDFFIFRDNSGRDIISDDAASGHGLGRPWLPIALYPLFVTGTADDTTGEAVAYWSLDSSKIVGDQVMWGGRASVSHPKIVVDGVWGRASGTPNITYRLKVAGETVGTWNESGGPVVAQRGPFDVVDHVGADFASVDVTAEVTSGTGGVACSVFGCYLRQS